MQNNPKPDIILYGALRSGTTLLRLMLDAHPQLSCPGETDFIFDHLPPGAKPNTPYEREALEADRIYRAHRDRFADIPLPDPTPDGFLDQIRNRGDVSILILHRCLDRVLEVYPDIPILHLVRDPRDVARSSIGMGWAGDVYHGARHWMRTEGDWQDLSHKMATEQVLEISYESLIQDPEGRLGAICDFIGVSYDPSMLSYDSGSTYDKPDSSLVEQWRRKLTPYQISLVEGRIGSLLEQTGYAPSGHPPITPTGFARFSLIARNKWFVWAERFRRYGVADPIVDAMCRRMGMDTTPLARRARRRMDQAQMSYLK